MMNLYTVEKRMEYEERERQQKANKAWMLPKKKQNRLFENSFKSLLELFIRKNSSIKKHVRNMYES